MIGGFASLLATFESVNLEIKNACDLADLVGQHVTLKRAGRDLRGLCPFHKEKTPSFYVRPTEQYFKCFGCGAAGDVFTFIQKIHSIAFPEARQMLADRFGIKLNVVPTQSDEKGQITRTQLLRVTKWAASLFQKCLRDDPGKTARDYIQHRRILPELVDRFQLGYAPDSYDFLMNQARRSGVSESLLLASGLVKPRQGGGFYDAFRHRLMFPIADVTGQIIAFGGRILRETDEGGKYINSPETLLFNKSKCLYGINIARQSLTDKNRAVLVEGYLDVIMAHQCGFSETIAALGTSMTDQHAEVIRRYVPGVVLVFDGDQAGIRAADRGCEIAVTGRLDVSLVGLPDGLDPCDYLTQYKREDFEELLIHAPTALEFKWQQVLGSHKASESAVARREAIQRFVRFVGLTMAHGQVDAIQRGLVVNQLAKLLGVSTEDVHKLVLKSQRMADARPVQSVRSMPEKAPSSSTSWMDAMQIRGSRQVAALEVLMMVIAQPDLYPQVEDILGEDVFDSERIKRITRIVLELCREAGQFGPTELLARFEDPQDAADVVELMEQGRRHEESPSERLTAARQRLESAIQTGWVREANLSPEESAGAGVTEPMEPDSRLSEMHDRVREYTRNTNFATLRALKNHSGASS